MSEASAFYLETYRRYNYTTPKSYLELIALYKVWGGLGGKGGGQCSLCGWRGGGGHG